MPRPECLGRPLSSVVERDPASGIRTRGCSTLGSVSEEQAGTHSVTMSVAYADFERLAGPTVADIAVAR